uniref:Uncharacterized protein n=1 Tax=Salarias fasciatus TaxID=181472 RepID=A0A672GGZ3_SALFA
QLCEKMQSSTSLHFFLLLILTVSFSRLQVAQVMNSRIGQYLSSHPFVALSVMLFSAMAALPFGLFLSFALVTLIMAAVGFVFFEGWSITVKSTRLFF